MEYPTKTITLYIPPMQTVETEKESKQTSSTTQKPVRRSEVEVKTKIGQGGMGIVFLGHQEILERNVAIKRLKKQNNRLAEALIHEAKITGNLEHPNIIPIHSVNILENEEPEVIMKYIQGTAFHEKISSSPTDQEIRENLQVLLQICHPLEFAHAQGIIHRDIKPENIMLGSFGEVYLLDWGLAFNINDSKKENSGLVGTPAYMAPEMLNGDPSALSCATDVYLLGASLHHVLVGTPRHSGKTIQEALANVRRSKPYLYPKGIISLIGAIANKACSPQVHLRHQTVLEFRNELSVILNRWEALKLMEVGENLLSDLQNLKESENIDQLRAHALYNQSRFAFEQSLKLFQENREAQQGINRTIIAMTHVMLKLGHFNYAQNLLYESSIQDPALQNEIRAALAEEVEREIEHRHIEEEAKHHDPKTSKSFREVLALSLLILTSIFALSMLGYQFVTSKVASPIPLILFGSAVSISVQMQKQKNMQLIHKNHVAQQVSITLLIGYCAVILVSACSLVYPQLIQPSPYVIALILFGIMYGSLYPILKSAPLLCIVGGIAFFAHFVITIPAVPTLCIYLLLCSIAVFIQWGR